MKSDFIKSSQSIFSKSTLREHWLVLLLFLLAFFVRVWSISDNSIMFWFDQARDAFVSIEMVEQLKPKLQGPTASGTGDSVFHGVLYYYVIAPAYFLSQGDPWPVAVFLSLVGSFSIFITYYLGLLVFGSRQVGLLAGFLQAASFVHIQASSWLSNPQLLLVTMPLFYLFIWKVFFTNKKTYLDLVGLGLLLGLSIQAGIYAVFLFVSLVLAYLFWFINSKSITSKKFLPASIWQVIAGITSFFVSISTMIVAQVLIVSRGVVSASDIIGQSGRDNPALLELAQKIISLFLGFLEFTLTAQYHFWLFLPLLLMFLVAFVFLSKKQAVWSAIFLAGPAWLLLLQFRDSPHTFNGVESIVYLLLAVSLVQLTRYKKRVFYWLAIGLVVIFAGTNLFLIGVYKENSKHYLGVQQDALLSDQLELIDFTYTLSDGKNFSISTLTSPYGVNTTWSYLYSWYGQNTYRYLPVFMGPPQAGWFGEGRLSESDLPSDIHFTIIEPDTGVNDIIFQDFLLDQYRRTGAVVQEKEFGSLIVQVRGGQQEFMD